MLIMNFSVFYAHFLEIIQMLGLAKGFSVYKLLKTSIETSPLIDDLKTMVPTITTRLFSFRIQ